MNIWVEYWKKEEKSKNTHAQIRELPKWKEPDPKKVSRRFCQSRDGAQEFALSMQEQGYHVRIKEDGGGRGT